MLTDPPAVTGRDDPPKEAYWAALTTLPDASPARLAAMSALEPDDALRCIAAGSWGRLPALAHLLDQSRRPSDGRARWSAAARSVDPLAVWEHHQRRGQQVVVAGSPGYPSAFDADPSPPHVLFLRGELSLLERVAVAIVGTRRCTRYGHDVAREWARNLSLAGVVVVSGLAAGIDAAAHHGAMEGFAAGGAPPVAVVGTGLDVPYPRRNAALWEQVATAGALCSEYPAGTRGVPWHFPARNRIIAALSKAVLVVESHATGGSIITATEAHDRGRTVLAVPGSVHSAASAGANRLLADIASPCVDFGDLLLAVGAFHPPPPDRFGGDMDSAELSLDPDDSALLDAFMGAPASLQELAQRVDRPIDQLSLDLTRLVLEGFVVGSAGYFERVRR